MVHASIPYMVSETPIWPVNDRGSWFFDVLVFESHLFVMELFFMISGFMFAIQLKGAPLQFIITNRLKKIALPFVFGLVLLVPVVLSLFSLSQHTGFTFFQMDIILQSYINAWQLGLEKLFPTAHLWYLYYLIIFYIITVLFRNLFAIKRTLRLSKILLLGISISSICMFFMDRWIVDNPLTLTPELPSLLHFYFFFALGLIVFSSYELLDELKKKYKYYLGVGIFLALGSVIPQFWFDRTDLEYYLLIKAFAIILSCSSIHILVVGIWGAFSSFSIQDSKPLRYLTDSSYWVYLSNMPIVAIFQIVLIPVDIPVFFKFVIALFGALAINLISYEFFVRYTFIGAILNKRRKRNSLSK